jgi:hypothetical protein
MSCARAYARTWGLDMEHGACVYTRTVPHLHHLPSTPEYGKIRYVAVYANSPRAYAYACTTPSSTHPPAASNSKQHLSESGPWLLPAGSCGWSAGAQIGARLTRLFPACHCQCLVSCAPPVSLRSAARICFLLFGAPLQARLPRSPLAGSRCAYLRPLCRLVPRGPRWVPRVAHTHTLCPLVVCTVTEAGR